MPPLSAQEKKPAVFSPTLFFAQAILIPPAILVFGGLAWALGVEFGILTTRSDESLAVMNALGYLACALTGFGLGRLVRHWLPRWADSGGKFVCILPVLVLICALGVELFSAQGISASRFFVARARMGEEGFGIFLFTLPAFGCCCYSLGAGLRKRFWRARSRV